MQRVMCALVAAFLVVPVAALDRKSVARAESLVAKADKKLEISDFAGAESLFRKAVEVEPQLPAPYVGLGAALVGLQRFAEALPVLEQAEAHFLEWEQLERQMTMEGKASADDRTLYADSMAGRPGGTTVPSAGATGGARTGSILAQAERSDIETQQHIADRQWGVDEIPPVPPQVYYLQGIALVRTNHAAEGMARLERCLELDANHGLAHYNLAVARFVAGEVPAARKHLDAARLLGIDAHPGFVADLEAAEGRVQQPK